MLRGVGAAQEQAAEVEDEQRRPGGRGRDEPVIPHHRPAEELQPAGAEVDRPAGAAVGLGAAGAAGELSAGRV